MKLTKRLEKIEKQIGEQAFEDRPFAHLTFDELINQHLQLIMKMGRRVFGDLYDDFLALTREEQISCVRGNCKYIFNEKWKKMMKIVADVCKENNLEMTDKVLYGKKADW